MIVIFIDIRISVEVLSLNSGEKSLYLLLSLIPPFDGTTLRRQSLFHLKYQCLSDSPSISEIVAFYNRCIPFTFVVKRPKDFQTSEAGGCSAQIPAPLFFVRHNIAPTDFFRSPRLLLGKVVI